MIRLTKLLSEALLEQRDKERLRILFVGDDNLRFARSLMKALNATGTINNFKGTTAAQILKIVKRQINESYDVVVIMASSYDGAPGKSRIAIKNLEEAFNLAKQYDAKLIAISNPSKSYLTTKDAKYKEHEYPSNDEIGTWVNNQTISDATIDVNSLDSKYLASDRATLNVNAQKYIIGQLKNMILGFDITPTANDTKSASKQDTKTADTKSVASAAASAGDATQSEIGQVKLVGSFNSEQAANIKSMIQYMNDSGITNPITQIGILSVIGKESKFIPQSEISYRNTSNSRIRSIFSKTASLPDAELDALKQDDEKFFNFVYGGRFGNADNEGYKYRGRGFNQLTFKGNYKKYGSLIGKDLVSSPDLLNDVDTAAAVAVEFFTKGKTPPQFKSKSEAVTYFTNLNAGGTANASNHGSAQQMSNKFDLA